MNRRRPVRPPRCSLVVRRHVHGHDNGTLLTQDLLGLADGVNLYAYAGNNPISFRDPFGLCAAGDSILVAVTIDCGDGSTSKRAVWAQQVSESDAAAVVTAAGHLTGGNKEYTPKLVAKGYAILAAAGSIYVFPASVDGHDVMEGGVTQTGDGRPPHTAFRSDALAAFVSGNLSTAIGNRGFTAAIVLGHEGAHLWGSKHPDTYRIKWGFKP